MQTLLLNQGANMYIDIHKLAVNPFVLRQTKYSPFSYSSLPFTDVINLLHDCAKDGRIIEGYPPESSLKGGRTIIARLSEEQTGNNFYSGITLIREGEEVVEGERARTPEEEPRPFREVVRKEKAQASTVDLVFYNSIALEQTNDNILAPRKDNWELISINASEDTCMDPPPISPTALRANFYGESGGTKTSMTQEEFDAQMEKSKEYWDPRATVRIIKPVELFVTEHLEGPYFAGCNGTLEEKSDMACEVADDMLVYIHPTMEHTTWDENNDQTIYTKAAQELFDEYYDAVMAHLDTLFG